MLNFGAPHRGGIELILNRVDVVSHKWLKMITLFVGFGKLTIVIFHRHAAKLVEVNENSFKHIWVVDPEPFSCLFWSGGYYFLYTRLLAGRVMSRFVGRNLFACGFDDFLFRG
jgi:hypothetical protein